MPEAYIQGVRVFLVDDHPAVREGLSLLLTNKGVVVCGEADCCEQALQLLPKVGPDVVLVDLSLGQETGIDLIGELGASGIKTLVYSMHDDAAWVTAALSAGANGYVTKREMATTLLEAIRLILAGESYISAIAAEALRLGCEDDGRRMLERLSEREQELFRKMGEGCSTADLAGYFAISPSTVETYYARINDKLGLSGTKDVRLHAIRYMKQK